MLIAVKDTENNTTLVANGLTERFVNTTKEDMVLDSNIPFWESPSPKGVYMAYSVSGYTADILRYANVLKDIDSIGNGVVLMNTVVDRVRTLLGEEGLLEDDASMDGSLLIASEGRVFVIDPYFCVKEVPEIIAAGYSSNMLLSGLQCAEGTPRERILEAIVNMDEMRGNRSFPIVLHSTKTGEKEVWYDREDALAKIAARG